jgi:hypothetical protein
MKPSSSLIFIFSAISLFTLCGLALHYVIVGPHGPRQAFLRLIDTDLANYAHDHGGALPATLDELYPAYSTPGVELAGLSGNVQKVTNALQRGIPISNITSWVYVPGLTVSDDPNIAVLWESEPGISASGKRRIRQSRAVLLLGSDISNVPMSAWRSFQLQQQQLRARTSTVRGSATKP